MNRKKKKALSMLAVVALIGIIAVGGMLAYLSDKDGEANVFTVGNVDIDLTEEFVQGTALIPGVEIEKKPTIENVGKFDAWVWATVAVPKNLDTAVAIDGTNDLAWSWGTPAVQNIDGVDYNVYTVKYGKLAAGKKTGELFQTVTLDGKVDIDAETGAWRLVDNGVVTDLGWNSNTGSHPVIYVNAYAIQDKEFASFDAAYAAYNSQWGPAAGDYDKVVTVETSDDLEDAVNDATESTTIAVKEGTYETNFKVEGGKAVTILGTGKDTVLEGQIATTASNEGTLTIKNVTIKVDGSIVDSTGISQTGKSAIAIWGDQTVICENVTFDMSLADSTAITSWWDTGKGTSIIVRDCTFNCNGQRPIRATGNVTVENCTFNDPYRYAVQLTAKASTATELDKAIINFNNNTIKNGPNGKAFVYGIQLEGATYGCQDCVINGAGNTIVDGGADSAMYYCECGKVDHATITWNTEVAAVHEN